MATPKKKHAPRASKGRKEPLVRRHRAAPEEPVAERNGDIDSEEDPAPRLADIGPDERGRLEPRFD